MFLQTPIQLPTRFQGQKILVKLRKNNGQILKENAKLLSSTAYDRKLEKGADLKAVEYIGNSRLDSEPFANFLFRLSLASESNLKHLVWIKS
ncbi:hypothetical protein [Marinifilum sp.]|uniref:hypothetical protein n=1 Tax=Marinifilum sp. TaxID=2033137 RepID=UPI003BA8AE3D